MNAKRPPILTKDYLTECVAQHLRATKATETTKELDALKAENNRLRQEIERLTTQLARKQRDLEHSVARSLLEVDQLKAKLRDNIPAARWSLNNQDLARAIRENL